MALTDNSDIAGRVHEGAFNTIIARLMSQRPDIFNYATKRIGEGDLFCKPIEADNLYVSKGFPLYTELDPFGIPGASDNHGGLQYCVQFRELNIDFTPENAVTLPPELGNLALQQFALQGKVCAGIGCERDLFQTLAVAGVSVATPRRGSAAAARRRASADSLRRMARRPGISALPIDMLKMHCFCLDLFVKAVIAPKPNELQLKVTGLELQDIAPVGLENAIECVAREMLDHVVLPDLAIAFEDLVFGVGDFFSVGLTPTGSGITSNPDVSNNHLSIFMDIN